MDVDQRVAYIYCILRGGALKKYKSVLLDCKRSAKDLAGDKWTLGGLKGLSIDNFYTWIKSGGVEYDRGAYLGL